MYPYYLVLTKPHKHNIKPLYFNSSEDSIDKVKNAIVNILQEEFQTVKTDIPDNYQDFVSNCWFVDKSIDGEIFEYKVFSEGKWIEPWNHDDLYDSVYEILYKLELIGGYINDANGFNDEEEIEDEENN